MVKCKKAQSKHNILEVCKAMKQLGSTNPLAVYGYWYKDKCIGGSFLTKEFPYYLVMGFYPPPGVSIVKAIRDSFVGLFSIKPKLLAKIDLTNQKSLKMIRQLGFYHLYVEHQYVVAEIAPETWRYQKRYPITKEEL